MSTDSRELNREMRALIIYGVLLLAATVKIASMPTYSFDSYLYSYIASSDVRSFKANPELPAEYARMQDETYVQQTPFYSVKVLFVFLTRLAAKFTGVLRAPTVVSATAYFLLGWVVWCWLGSAHTGEPWRSASALLLMFSSVVTDTARMGTPDTLCTLLLLLGAWLIFETKYAGWGGLALVLSVLTRLDCAILAVALLVLGYWQHKVSTRVAATVALAIAVCYVAISRMGYPYHDLLAWTIRTSYLRALVHNFVKTELAIYSPFALLALIAIRQKYQLGIIAACGLSLAARYILMPHLEIRYLLPQAMIVGIVGASAVLSASVFSKVEKSEGSSLLPDESVEELRNC